MKQKWRTYPVTTGLHIVYVVGKDCYTDVYVRSLITNEIEAGGKVLSIESATKYAGALLWLQVPPAPSYDELLAAELEGI